MALEVRVIAPTHNRADLFAETLASILNQAHQPSGIVIVDDGSRGNSEAIAREFGSQIKYLRIESAFAGFEALVNREWPETTGFKSRSPDCPR
jgi:glycosyltransferase involved in cell wall biosynthesis